METRSKINFQMNKCYHQMSFCPAALLSNGENVTAMSLCRVLYRSCTRVRVCVCDTRLPRAVLLVLGGCTSCPTYGFAIICSVTDVSWRQLPHVRRHLHTPLLPQRPSRLPGTVTPPGTTTAATTGRLDAHGEPQTTLPVNT